MIFCRGQDVSEFLPHPDVIIMADLIYYIEVSTCYANYHVCTAYVARPVCYSCTPFLCEEYQ